jgi:hypothetical protein
MADMWISIAGYGGMVSALLWLGILPYLLERKRAEQNGEKPPSFAGSYLTTMVISAIGGFITLGMAIGELEKALASATTLFTAAGIGFSFTYTILGISNQIVDLKLEQAKLKREITILNKEVSKA